MGTRDKVLADAQQQVKDTFTGAPPVIQRVPSTAHVPRAERLDRILLPDSERGRMPLTKDDYLVKENPHLVQWERELRKFLRKLSPEHEHRVAAVHVFEWATGMSLAELQAAEKTDENAYTGWRGDLRKLNQLLREYFGKPYMTWIANRKIPKAYRVPKGFYIYRKRPITMSLWVEWSSGVKL